MIFELFAHGRVCDNLHVCVCVRVLVMQRLRVFESCYRGGKKNGVPVCEVRSFRRLFVCV